MTVDLIFYEEFCGGDFKIPAAEFERWERAAYFELSRITGGKSTQSLEECVKICICEIAELLYKMEMQGKIKSENNDGYSVTYQEGDTKNALTDIAKRYLSGTDYLYRGVCNDG